MFCVYVLMCGNQCINQMSIKHKAQVAIFEKQNYHRGCKPTCSQSQRKCIWKISDVQNTDVHFQMEKKIFHYFGNLLNIFLRKHNLSLLKLKK